MINLDELLVEIKATKLPTEDTVFELCQLLRDLLITEPNTLSLHTPITLCGDIHGQFHDLLTLFEVGGQMPDTQYLFMGDFVDRGHHSVETVLLLFVLKARYPDRIALIRGNHESREVTQIYGFYDECLQKYNGSPLVWRSCCEVFDYLPLAALIDNNILTVHGGLSPAITSINQLKLIDRVREVPHEGAMSDILWSDPDDTLQGWGLSPRGAGYLFGSDVATHFLVENSLTLLARAHQLVMEGYKYSFDERVITVWSAPNYCYRCGNVAAVMRIEESGERKFKVFESKSLQEAGLWPTKAPPITYFL